MALPTLEIIVKGSVIQRHRCEERKIAIPLVHALLESKQECAYGKVIQETLNYAENSGDNQCR